MFQGRYVSTDGAAPNRAAIKRAMTWNHAVVKDTEFSLHQPGQKEIITFIMDIKVCVCLIICLLDNRCVYEMLCTVYKEYNEIYRYM